MEDIVTFIQSTHVFDLNGKEYKVVIKDDKTVRVYDSFSKKEIFLADVKDVYFDSQVPGIVEAFFLHRIITEILKK
jgi:hypothetical protein